ncbi:MAG: polysaccharide deacetylase family protein [Clostridia bacterium]|nr:polysaccharide deacetylase family protein [Clostridia bacterium]
MEGRNREQKPDRSVKPAAKPSPAKKDAKKTIAEMESRRAGRNKAQQQKRQLIILAAALIVIVALIIIIAVSCSKGGANDETIPGSSTEPAQVNVIDPSASPTPEPETESYTALEYLQALVPEATAQPEQYLPVIKNGPASNKRIAITVDDLNEVDNLNKIMTIAESNGAKLTLFAIGDVVTTKDDLKEALRRADGLGFEIENHTYNHDRAHRLYSLTDEEMAFEIYETQKAVNNALGVEYEMHFLRMPGGNGENDLRTHQYLIQLGGYKGIADWSYSGSDASLKNIRKNLKPGYIYLFHCKKEDLDKLEEFIPYAVSQGYELVTLNDLLGYEANAKTGLNGAAMDYEIPEPLPFVYQTFVLLGNKGYTQLYAVQLLQNRLIELGYLTPTAAVDGDYGSNTKLAVQLFQRYNGLEADGLAGSATQTLLFSSAAVRNPSTYIAGDESTYPSEAELEMFKTGAV